MPGHLTGGVLGGSLRNGRRESPPQGTRPRCFPWTRTLADGARRSTLAGFECPEVSSPRGGAPPPSCPAPRTSSSPPSNRRTGPGAGRRPVAANRPKILCIRACRSRSEVKKPLHCLPRHLVRHAAPVAPRRAFRFMQMLHTTSPDRSLHLAAIAGVSNWKVACAISKCSCISSHACANKPASSAASIRTRCAVNSVSVVLRP